jgi:tetratricopeptide (TPR) repeat protein
MKLLLLLLANAALWLTLAGAARAQKAGDDPMSRAIADMQAGRTDKAIADLGEVIKLQPDNADAYFLRSQLRASSGDTDGALADLNKAVELKPGAGSFYYNRAIVGRPGGSAKGRRTRTGCVWRLRLRPSPKRPN